MVRTAQFRCLVAFLVVALPAAAAQAMIIETVPVGNTDNTADDTGYGAVDYAYNIGTYEVTAGQYTAFLNAVAKTDTYGLYQANMDYSIGITRSGASGDYSYTVNPAFVDRPVNYVTFLDAARFANWLHNGQPTGAQGLGTTEDGAYINIGSQADFARQPNAIWFIPTENEWYKAAYHKNDGDTGNYFDYPTGSDTAPGRDLADTSGNNANYAGGPSPIDPPYWTTVVGEFQNSGSPYGTFDQAGNIYEWNETVTVPRLFRVLRGGSFGYPDDYLHATYRRFTNPAVEASYIGFRVASAGNGAVPEPGSLVMLAGLAGMGLFWWKRRKVA